MATWMVHLRIADRFLDLFDSDAELAENHRIEQTEFVVGNIAPDSGIPSDDWTRFSPPKMVSHFKTKDSPGGADIDTDAFCRQHFSAEQRARYDGKAYSFFLGYLVHLLSDIEWKKRITDPLLSAYKAESAADYKSFIWKCKAGSGGGNHHAPAHDMIGLTRQRVSGEKMPQPI